MHPTMLSDIAEYSPDFDSAKPQIFFVPWKSAREYWRYPRHNATGPGSEHWIEMLKIDVAGRGGTRNTWLLSHPL